jgi:hypothetical protein
MTDETPTKRPAEDEVTTVANEEAADAMDVSPPKKFKTDEEEDKTSVGETATALDIEEKADEKAAEVAAE